MIPFRYLLSIFCCTFLAVNSSFAADATVARVQKIVELQRVGVTSVLKVGDILKAGDVIKTGEDARLQIRISDNSFIQIGDNAQVQVDKLLIEPMKQQSTTFSSVLNVSKGAFRFLSNKPDKHEVKVHVNNTITAGLRGTDVYFEAEEHRDFVCLISGEVEVSAKGVSAILNKPRQFFVVPKGKDPLPVSFLEEAKFNKWVEDINFKD